MPPRIWDAHAHLYRDGDGFTSAPQLTRHRDVAGRAEHRQAVQHWLGRSPAGGLFFGFPGADTDLAGANAFVREEVRGVPAARGLMLIRPADDPAAVEAAVEAEGWAGLKVYHVYADLSDTYEAEVGEFLPEWAWELAERFGLAIMLHLVRRRALADAANQAYVREHCRRYPNARLILAHAARGFCGRHTVEGVQAVGGLDNLYFDTSAICEPAALEAVLREYGPDRLLFGTDFPVSEMLGRCVSVGDGFLWVYADTLDWNAQRFASPVQVGLESLLALHQACRTMCVTDGGVEQIFFDNARELFGIPACDG